MAAQQIRQKQQHQQQTAQAQEDLDKYATYVESKTRDQNGIIAPMELSISRSS